MSRNRGRRDMSRNRGQRDTSAFRRLRTELANAAAEQGWIVQQTEKGHWQFIPPDRSKRIVVLPGSSVSRSGMRNAVADLRRSGLVVEQDRRDPTARDTAFQKRSTKELREALAWAEAAVLRARRSGIEIPRVHYRFIQEVKTEIERRRTQNDPRSRASSARGPAS